MTISLTHNAPQVAADVRRLRSSLVRGPISSGVNDFMELVVKRARRSNYGFSDQTGTLRASIRNYGITTSLHMVTGVVASNVHYARYVEEVSSGRFSYLQRALQETGSRLLESILLRRIEAWASEESSTT